MSDLLELLKYIPPSSLDYQEWVNVGMALKHEGYSVDVWDSWSQADSPSRTSRGKSSSSFLGSQYTSGYS